MARWSQRERVLLAALVFSYGCVFPMHVLIAGSLPEGAMTRDGGVVNDSRGGTGVETTADSAQRERGHAAVYGVGATKNGAFSGGGSGSGSGGGSGSDSGSGSESGSGLGGGGGGGGGGDGEMRMDSSGSQQRHDGSRDVTNRWGATARAAPSTPRWVTSGGAPTAHVAALANHGVGLYKLNPVNP
jgi:hypothetical protein